MNEKGEIIMPLPLILGGGFGCDMDGLVSGLSVREIAANRIMNKKGKKGKPKKLIPRERHFLGNPMIVKIPMKTK